MSDHAKIEAIARAARPILGAERDYDELIDMVGDARLVLIGEASHGTYEFYHERARITRRLIAERGFCAVAAEADWPDAYAVNCFVRGAGDAASPDEALAGFRRFPQWMWRNRDVERFVAWLRDHNALLPLGAPRAGFYGLDLYNLSASIEGVIGYLDGVDPEAARRARARYSCLEHFSADPQRYGFAIYTGAAEPCEDDVVEQLVELQSRAAELAAAGPLADEARFAAEQNARLAAGAEQYYRSMFQGRVSSWNLRDTHMADSLDALVAFLDRQVGRARVVVWAHNSHLGDARATEMGDAGEINLGQLARERYGRDAFLVGFSTYGGAVTAAEDWDEPGRERQVRPGLPGSYEALLHAASAQTRSFMLSMRDPAVAAALAGPQLQRAIGVVYRPETERRSHYFYARLPAQFDALIHIDQTAAVEPLERRRDRAVGEPPETFPTGL